MSKSRGSAILIAVFLLAAVGSIAFGIGRLFLLESNIAGLYENSTAAYYAAESGIEEGLLRYRYDRNAELPLVAGYAASNLISRNNLELGPGAQGDEASPFSPENNSDHIYALQMSHYAAAYGTSDPNQLATPQYFNNHEYQIARDESIKIDVTSVSPDPGHHGDLNLYVRANPATCVGYTDYSSFIEVKVSGLTASGLSPAGSVRQERKAVLLGHKDTPPRATDINPIFPVIGSRVRQYSKLLNAVQQSNHYSLYTQGSVELTLHPVGCDVSIALDPVNPDLITQPFTTLKSGGYYGGVSRTLEAKIDRQAGTIYDLFDYVIYERR